MAKIHFTQPNLTDMANDRGAGRARTAVREAAKTSPSGGRLALSVRDLEVRYAPSDGPAITGVNLDAFLGEMILFVGPNGGGKTTLLRSLAGLVRPFRGGVTVLGGDPLRLLSIRRMIGYVPQARELNINAPLTVWDLVSLGRYPHIGPFKRLNGMDVDVVEQSLSRVRLEDVSSKRISEISGGQLSRAILARALAQDPLIYLLDEPLESIDQPTESSILEVLEEEKRRGKLIIITEHHISDPSRFDRAVLINRTIIAVGKPLEILTEERIREAYGPLPRHVDTS